MQSPARGWWGPCQAVHQKESVKNMQFIDLKTQYHALKTEIDANIRAVLDSAQFIGGPYVKELEKQLAEFTGRKHCITCANGTDALQLAYMVAGVGPGDAVFCPDMTFISSTEPAKMFGAASVFCDITPDTYCLCPESLERQIQAGARGGKTDSQSRGGGGYPGQSLRL